ncbi:unnamed protein product [Lepeophtheirus salmonis]|nr:unnamed protein product [Lepeophtheirus salmonis]CAF3034968.1 unnamed protein product [Lepeophtheirus salmonis]
MIELANVASTSGTRLCGNISLSLVEQEAENMPQDPNLWAEEITDLLLTANDNMTREQIQINRANGVGGLDLSSQILVAPPQETAVVHSPVQEEQRPEHEVYDNPASTPRSPALRKIGEQSLNPTEKVKSLIDSMPNIVHQEEFPSLVTLGIRGEASSINSQGEAELLTALEDTAKRADLDSLIPDLLAAFTYVIAPVKINDKFKE